MVGHLLRDFQLAAVLQALGDARRAEGIVPNLRENARALQGINEFLAGGGNADGMQPPLATPSCDRRSSCKGFSLIEAAIVLGIVGLVIGGIWVAASSVQESRRQSLAVEEMVQIVNNLRNLYRGQNISSDIIFARSDGIVGNIFPAEMLVDSSRIVNPWGLNAGLALYSNSGSPYIYLSFDLADKVSSCATLAPKLMNAFRAEEAGGGYPKVGTGANALDLTTTNLAASNCYDEVNVNGEFISIVVSLKF